MGNNKKLANDFIVALYVTYRSHYMIRTQIVNLVATYTITSATCKSRPELFSINDHLINDQTMSYECEEVTVSQKANINVCEKIYISRSGRDECAVMGRLWVSG